MPMRPLFRSAGLLVLCLPGLAQTSGVSYVIDTVAGSDVFQDNGQAVDTWLWQPEGVAVDALGAVYVADTNRSRILRVAADGSFETFAGTGVSGMSGDGGPATEARIFRPTGMAFGPDGSLYYSDLQATVDLTVGLI